MAIFSGSWTDAEGAPFDAGSFVIQQGVATDKVMVTGPATPDCTGLYLYAGIHNAAPCYNRHDGAWAVWKGAGPSPFYRITEAPDFYDLYIWRRRPSDDAPGEYVAGGSSVGDVDVVWANGGVSRQRIFGRRGGCGSPPGQHHGSPAQAAARLSFGNRAREYVDMPPASPDTQWEIDGQAANHYTRAGAFKKMHGQAFYPRSADPKTYGGQAYLLAPDSTKTFPPIDQIRCQYNTAFTWAQVDLHFTGAYAGDIYSGISIFQVRPLSREKAWERKHTRIAWSGKVWKIVGAGWADYPFDLVWPCQINDQLRVLVRVWHYEAFSPWAPITSQPF